MGKARTDSRELCTNRRFARLVHSMRPALFLASAAALATMLSATSALADIVALMPAEGRVPGKALTSTLAHETRYAIMELGHSLVSEVELEAVARQIADGKADDADEFDLIAKKTGASWVVVPVIYSDTAVYRLELTAYMAETGRSESVTRDIDAEHIHQQVVEMAKVLLSASGVGTDALPWEATTPPPTIPNAQQQQTTRKLAATSGGMQLLAGLTLGVASAISRPDEATGSSTAFHGGLRAGIQLDSPFEVALGLRANLSGPKAKGVDVSARYWIPVTPGFKLASELAPGLFFMGGGAQKTSFMLRATAVGSVKVSDKVTVEAHVGDVTWVPSSSGTVLLGGATVGSMVRF